MMDMSRFLIVLVICIISQGLCKDEAKSTESGPKESPNGDDSVPVPKPDDNLMEQAFNACDPIKSCLNNGVDGLRGTTKYFCRKVKELLACLNPKLKKCIAFLKSAKMMELVKVYNSGVKGIQRRYKDDCKGLQAKVGCEKEKKAPPVYLTPYLRQNRTDKAREMSRVDSNYLEGSVPPSHAGLVTVNETLKNNLFFWYFPSPAPIPTNSTAPLLLWLGRRPGMSAMVEVFYENGPVQVDPSSTAKNVRYSKRENSWVGPFSMLYVDNLVNVGFSSSLSGEEGDRYTEEAYTEDMYEFLTQFFNIFPDQKSADFYIGGQFYAGMYATSLAHHIHTVGNGDAALPSLTGVYLGSPFYDAEIQWKHSAEIKYHIGSLSFREFQETNEFIESHFQSMSTMLNSLGPVWLDTFFDTISKGSVENFVTLQNPPYKQVEDLMNSYVIKQALHMGDELFVMANARLQKKLLPDAIKSRREKLGVLMDNYKVLIYNGNLDTLVSTSMIEASLRSVEWIHNGTYNTNYILIPYEDNPQRAIDGFFYQVGNLCRVIINGAGHHTAHDKPAVTLKMMKSFVNQGCLEYKEWV